MTITLNEIRNTYLSFFEKRGHKIIPSSSLVPDNDPTLMFTNSGMVQFKNIFTGTQKAEYARATTSQKCVRAGGKHNDLDNVGYTVRHHTFFEMLGNFSFGDYFKEEAIKFAWDMLTKDFAMDPEKLLVTIYHTDDEAHDIWKKVSGFSDDKIIRIAGKDNFWQMGDTGPCGPSSEIFYDHGEHVWGGKPGTAEQDGDRYIEIWNLVFDQFEDLPDGSRISIPNPSIDTGMGLERFAAILQGVHSNYEIDLFQNLIAEIANYSKVDPEGKFKSSFNVIADHLRSSSFLIADGVLPSNEGRGYVLRRIMRRAMRHANMIGIKEPVMYKLLPSLQKEMGDAYPELYRAEGLITETIKLEETRFGRTLERGLGLLDDETKDLKAGDVFSGETAFKLYDTYGFPLDLTQDALRNKDISVDVDAFNSAMEKQKAEARKNWAGSGDAGTDKIWFELQDKLGKTEFLGYNTTKADALITALVVDGKEVQSVEKGEFFLVANQTPFYGESGGQVGDIGKIFSETAEIKVTDVKKKLDGLFVHQCTLIKGNAKAGESMTFEVDEDYRKAVAANHSVTHLLHRVLQDKFGSMVTQKGSQVGADKMRFDIAFNKQMSEMEIREIENEVNKAIRANYVVDTKVMLPDEAMKLGAMALFGEKYGEEVRVVCMGDGGVNFSMELCGGTHVKRSGDIGYFNIISESAIAAGIRRLECVTGPGAEKFVQDIEDKIHRVGQSLKSSFNDIEQRVNALLEDKKKLEAQIFELKKAFANNKTADNLDKVDTVNGINFVGRTIPNTHPKELKAFVDEIFKHMPSGIVVLATDKDGKASIVVGVSKDLTEKYSAVDLVKAASIAVGGQGGGGRPDMAQAGGPDGGKIADAIVAVREVLEK